MLEDDLINKYLSKINSLEGSIIDMEFELQKLRLERNVYLSIIQDIKQSCKDYIKTNEENIRFNLGEPLQVEVVEHLLNYINNIARIYKLRI